MVREVVEMIADPESIFGTGSPPKVNQFFQLVGPIITSRFNSVALPMALYKYVYDYDYDD